MKRYTWIVTFFCLSWCDEPCRIFLERCQEAQEDPPPDDWNGVYPVKVK